MGNEEQVLREAETRRRAEEEQRRQEEKYRRKTELKDERQRLEREAAPRAQGGHEMASSTDIARPLPISLKEKTPEVRQDSNLWARARTLSNTNFRSVACVLLVLQGIGRTVYGIGVCFSPYSIGNPNLPLILLILFGSAAPPVIIAFGINRQERWARVLGLIAAGIGVWFDLTVQSEFDPIRLLPREYEIPPILSVVIGVIVIIYLIRGYRPVSHPV
jgi:hypothetical protein